MQTYPLGKLSPTINNYKIRQFCLILKSDKCNQTLKYKWIIFSPLVTVIPITSKRKEINEIRSTVAPTYCLEAVFKARTRNMEPTRAQFQHTEKKQTGVQGGPGR